MSRTSKGIYSFFVITCLFYSTMLWGQSSKIDSLKKAIALAKKDTNEVNALIALSTEVLNNDDIAGSLDHAKEALLLAESINFIKGMAYANKSIGMANYYQGNFEFVLEHWSNSLENFESIKDTLGIANMVNNLGAVYYSQGAHAKAIDYYLQSLSISEKLGEDLRIATALVNIGNVYSDGVDDLDKGLEYYNQLEPYLDVLKDDQITTAYLMGKGYIYKAKGDYDNALKFYNEALPLNENEPYERTHINTYLGQLYAEMGDYDKAIPYIESAYTTAKENNLQLDEIQSLIEMSKIYLEIDPDKAFQNLEQAEVLAKKLKVSEELRDIYKVMSETYFKKKDYAQAYNYQSRYLLLKDSIFNLETNDKIRGLQFAFDLEKKEDEIDLLEKEAEITRERDIREQYVTYASIISAGLILLLAIGLYRRYRFINKTSKIIEKEKDRAEGLLLNILPEETAIELQEKGKVEAKKFDQVTVMFTDFKNFTNSSEDLTPENLVKSVDYYFSKFDEIMDKHGLEKIKTIGDAYMCAGGLHSSSENHSLNMIQAAFDIIEFMEETKNQSDEEIKHFDIRIGINTGPVVAGVVGTKKFAYDIWGDTVNVASRMESMSQPGRINISENTHKLIKDHFSCKYRGEIDVKNKGMMKMYFVTSQKRVYNITENKQDVISTI